MDMTHLQQLRQYCRDEEAFAEMQKILGTDTNQTGSAEFQQFLGKSDNAFGGRDITELRRLQQEAYTAIMQAQAHAERQVALASVIAKIRQSLDIETIFNATTTEVRQLLNADRVGVFRFDAEFGWHEGEFIAESVLPEFPAALMVRVRDYYFGDRCNVQSHKTEVQAVDDIYDAGLSESYIHILSQFQIKAYLSVPLMHSDRLWGLLCIHQCSHSRSWEASEITFVHQVASQLDVALQQAELLAQTQQQAKQLQISLRELHKTQSQLIQNEKMSSLGHLVSGVAHEINNPVNFIYGNLGHVDTYASQLIQIIAAYQAEHSQPSASLQELIEEADLEFLVKDFPKIIHSMNIGAERIRQIVMSLRNFTRIDEAKMKPVNIHDGIDSTLLILQHRLKRREGLADIQLFKKYRELPLVTCYASQLNQVFMNILSNAIDALEEGEQRNRKANLTPTQGLPTISISTELIYHPGASQPLSPSNPQPHVLISIADNGMGIDEETRSHIFNPFFTTKPIGQGTGLGLSISYQIVVEKHGGILECISEPQKGTEFRIIIPTKLPAGYLSTNDGNLSLYGIG